ncbi:hypothetical protein [Nocardioides mangrovi]|uniref:DUF2206 domain-containing protein n=1 Tax=Nocardioides mangrovi TaxID=2874580 RepID=A0ABS7U9K3_9ACTN|nr:hypothetical protein [Nocardioides mangrovi]MBZ5737659.1 hypothetical protein [Nocardioides mangrovi]
MAESSSELGTGFSLPWTPELRRLAERASGPWALATRAAPYLLVVLAQTVVGLDLDLPVLRPALALATFVGLPTLALYRRATLPGDTRLAQAAYAFGFSILALLLGGLLLNTALPRLGVAHPLAPLPLAITWLVLDVAVLRWRRALPLAPAGWAGTTARAVREARFATAPTLAVVSLLCSVAGAIRLNNGAGGAVAVAAVVAGAGSLLALLLGRTRSTGRDAACLALVSAGLLLATSLRGWGITGHDIQAEFLAFRLTDGAQQWQLDALPSAYNACLSVTILPTVLAQATGLSGEIVFEVLLQLVFAVVPVLTYLLSRRFVSRRLALVATILTIAFPTFATDMPYLVRQEMAFFFLALVLLAATEPGHRGWYDRVLVVALGLGVVLSHYSTTYVLLMALGAGLVGLALVGVVRRRRGRGPYDGALVLLHPGVVVALVALTLVWAGPVTHTGGHASEVLQETVDAITGQGVDGPSSSDTSYWILSGDQTTPRDRMDLFVDATLDARRAEIPQDQRVFTHLVAAELRPALAETPSSPIGDLARIAAAALMQVFLLLGLLRVLRRGLGRSRMGAASGREAACLAWGSMAALGAIVVVPNLSVDYGVLRAFQQTLLVVAPIAALGLVVALRPVTAWRPRLALVLLGLVPVGMYLALTGVVPAFTGDQPQRMALANAGTYYDRFFSTDAETRGLHWLAEVDHADTTNARVIGSRNVNVRLLGLSDNRAPVSDRLYPTMLSKDAYVFIDAQVLDQGESTIFYTGDLLTYRYPLGALDHRMDLVYDAPQARVYR